jgi:hypothetical protein
MPILAGPVEVRARQTVQVTVQLSTQAVPLNPLIVMISRRERGQLDEFNRRKATHASGYFIDQKEIERRPVASASTLLLGVPGVALNRDGLRDRNEILMMSNHVDASGPTYCRATLYVDGRLIPQGSIDDVMPASWVGAIEVYPRGSSAPLEYRLQNDCGVVLYWTQERETGRGWSWTKLGAAGVFLVGAVLLTR